MLRALLLPLIVASLSLTGCIIDDDPDPVIVTRGYGLLTVTWTVDGTDDPAICAFEGADAIDIFVERSSGGMAAHVTDVCEAFITSVELRPGSYFADALLTDPVGSPITTAVDLGYFDIYGGDELVIDADFPSDSFY
jgi:hypothetical protein